MGEVTLNVKPCPKLNSIQIGQFGKFQKVKGISVCTFLKDKRVAERQAKGANKYLETRGLKGEIETVYDRSNVFQKGSSIVLWARTDTGVILGGDAIGELHKASEIVGKEAAKNLFTELKSKATVDVHLADMLVPYMALAQGESVYLVRHMTEHLATNIWLAQKILCSEFKVTRFGNLFRIQKM
jgi:RNA 3'-terminal phosphate cyclase